MRRWSNENTDRPRDRQTGDQEKREDLGLAGALSNLSAEAGFFEADFGFFDFGWQASRLQALFGFFHGGLRTVHSPMRKVDRK